MKRNLILGITLIGAAALSSCSTTKLASVKSSAFDDDVYYTRAKAGDSQNFMAANQMSYNTDDDYYYYGDYASRLARFDTYSPFSYSDNFYYSYVPYNNGFGAGTAYDRDYYAYNYGFGGQPNNGFLSNYVYSPYDYGYDPYSFGYDDFGYGDIYSAYLFGGYDLGYGGDGGYTYYGGGGYTGHRHHNNGSPIVAGNNPAARGARTGGSPGITRISGLPGRPVLSVNPNNGTVTRLTTNGINTNSNNQNNNNVNRQAREAFRPQTQSFNNTSSSSSNSGGGSSAGAGGGGGGGGRPGRP